MDSKMRLNFSSTPHFYKNRSHYPSIVFESLGQTIISAITSFVQMTNPANVVQVTIHVNAVPMVCFAKSAEAEFVAKPAQATDRL